ncbi:MAG TPA: alpha/beta hydrolase family protein [Acidobacteriaceae bacterium]
MLHELYARWMYRWETALTTRDENRVVRPLEWGFDWLEEYTGRQAPSRASAGEIQAAGRAATATFGARPAGAPYSGQDRSAAVAEPIASASDQEASMLELNRQILADSAGFFDYTVPADYRLEQRHPALFPTNVRPETLAQDAELKARAARGDLSPAEFLRFTSPVRTPYPENDLVNARWYPARPDAQTGARPRKAIIVMPQWNADAFSHNALCSLFNHFGVSALRLSKPYHDIRRPAELERSDYAVSSNLGRTLAACRQAVVDIRCCLDWLETQGYEQLGVLGTSLGSCYAFLAAAHDERLQVCAFNHASTSFGDVVWTGQSTRHIRAAFEQAGLTRERLNALWGAISPVHYMERFRDTAARRNRRTLVVHATYDLTFLRQFSLEVLRNFDLLGIAYESRVLPCGHYTTGETPYKFLDGWYLGSFVYQAFR